MCSCHEVVWWCFFEDYVLYLFEVFGYFVLVVLCAVGHEVSVQGSESFEPSVDVHVVAVPVYLFADEV